MLFDASLGVKGTSEWILPFHFLNIYNPSLDFTLHYQ